MIYAVIITFGFSAGLLSMAVALLVAHFKEKKEPKRYWEVRK